MVFTSLVDDWWSCGCWIDQWKRNIECMRCRDSRCFRYTWYTVQIKGYLHLLSILSEVLRVIRVFYLWHNQVFGEIDRKAKRCSYEASCCWIRLSQSQNHYLIQNALFTSSFIQLNHLIFLAWFVVFLTKMFFPIQMLFFPTKIIA